MNAWKKAARGIGMFNAVLFALLIAIALTQSLGAGS